MCSILFLVPKNQSFDLPIQKMLLELRMVVVLIYLTWGSASATPLAPAMYVFGDSLVDSGNNNLLPTLARANYRPYGVDFEDGVTGRFTNGRTVADFIAEYVGLPYPPPVIGFPRLCWRTGFNYASGSCGILHQTGSRLGKCLNLGEQIKLFEGTIKLVLKRQFETSRDLSLHLSKSIFLLSVGNNDYINNYLDSSSDISQIYNPNQFADLLMHHLSLKLQKLYQLGARKMVLFELGPIGCVPSITRRHKGNGTCLQDINDIVSVYNQGLGPLLSNLTSILPGSHFVLGRAHGLGYDAIINPSKYGLKNTRDPCCKAWMNNTESCIPHLKPCEDANQHYFWDAYHLTEAMCSLVASRCIHGSNTCVPLNIQQLVQL